MNTQINSAETNSNPSHRALRLLKDGWLLLQAHERRPLSQLGFARHLGRSDSTVGDWVAGKTELAQLEAALRLFERLPETDRNKFLNRYLRTYPSLESNRLGHDPAAVLRLGALLSHTTGLTYIQCESTDLLTYVFGALAHEASRHGSLRNELSGIDVLSAESYVPVPGLLYPRHDYSLPRIQQHARQLLKAARARQLLWFNGLWSLLPEMRGEMLTATAYAHVLVAELLPLEILELKESSAGKACNVRRVQIQELDADRINVEILSPSTSRVPAPPF